MATSSVNEKRVSHTPGPWHVEPHHAEAGTFRIEEARQQFYSLCDAGSSIGSARVEAVDAANARLIAAAPELLQLVRESLQHFTEDQDPDNDTPHLIDLRDWTKAARAAIAKTEGR